MNVLCSQNAVKQRLTAAHELTHFIKEKSPENFEALERIVAEGFTKKGLSIDALIDKQIEKAKNDGREISREDAREEMIADACETMLADGSLIKKLSAQKSKNKGLWNAIKQFFENLFGKIDKLYRNLKPDSAEGKYIADMRKTAKKLKAAFAEGLTAVSGKKTRTSNSNIRYSSRAEENISKKYDLITSYSNEKLYSNAVSVLKMPIVAKLSGNEFSNDGVTKLKDKVIEFFDSFDNAIKTKELGIVAVNNASFRDDRAHGITRNKIVSFKAIPEVLSNGEIIDIYQPEGKQYQRITIAAPIKIADEKFYMAAMIQRDTQSNRLYLHDVITEKATLSFTTEPTADNGEVLRDKGHLFITSILQKALNVNSKKTENIKPSARSNNMSTGQINKLKANYTHEKVYSKKLAFDIISRFSSAGDFKAKTREAIAESLWEGLNGCTSIEERNTFAHDTAVFVVGKMLSESRANNPEAEAAREKLAYLRSGIQRITFSESDIEEIKHLRDVAGRRSIQIRWGYKNNSSGKTKFNFYL